MPSPPQHHAEWLSLIEISGPFLSMPVLMEVFPHGLNQLETGTVARLRTAYEEWLDFKNEPAIHTAWLRFVLTHLLDFEEDVVLLAGQAVPLGLTFRVPQQGVTLRPDMVLIEPDTRKPRLLIHTYPPNQDLEKAPRDSHWQASCASRMMEMLHGLNIPLGLLTNGEHWMLVHAPVGETTGYISWYSELWFSERLTLHAFATFLEAARFFGVTEDQTLEGLLQRSSENQHDVTDQLGAQVRSAVQILVQSLDRADQDRGRTLLTDVPEERLYEAAITIMMRLVFMLFAEERGLFPVNERLYTDNYAISTLHEQLRADADQYGEEILERRFDAWSRLLAVARMVFGGVRHDRLNLPAYGGSLFDPDRFPFLEGRATGTHWHSDPADPLPIDNRTVLHLLEAIQFLRLNVAGQTGKQRLSFRALDIEQIGHIYEGLLEYKAARADEVMLGLSGTSDHPLPFFSLAELEALRRKGLKPLTDEIKDRTGRSVSAIKRAIDQPIDLELAGPLQAACGNDPHLYTRLTPFAHLLRQDDYDNWVVIHSGSVYVTRGTTRRATGTHYTPRSLTEPIVQHTLEPLVYHGPAEGLPEEEWRLYDPACLLDLKICDMAMGSGSFLVQVIRYLSERLLESWDALAPVVEPGRAAPVWISPEGQPLQTDLGALPNDAEARLILAKRLIADRCIYGVDKNPLAVEMAKLSLWLATLAKNRAFTFLDHALKCGDSLVGIDEETFLSWAKGKVAETTWSLFDEEIRKELDNARRKRRELEAFEVRDITDVVRKEALLKEADAATQRVKLGCDLLVGARLQGLSDSERQAEENWLLTDWLAGETKGNERCQRAQREANKVRAFHWFLEFPEVFERGGFEAIIGNPPFLGGKRISTYYGIEYLNYIKNIWSHRAGSSDLCGYFFLQAHKNIRLKGTIGLIATNTISQGDTREVSLEFIVSSNSTIYRAYPSIQWPGQASVSVSVIHIVKGKYSGSIFLSGEKKFNISSLLDANIINESPKPLFANDQSHIGSLVLGMGFVLEPKEADKLIRKDSNNQDVLYPYINASDLNSNPDQSPSRWVINFFNWPLDEAGKYPDCLDIVQKKVLPERKNKPGNYSKLWWQYGRKQERLYEAIAPLDRTLICPIVTKYLSFVFVPTSWVYAHRCCIFSFDNWQTFSLLQSNFHNLWTRTFSSTLETRLNYSPTDCFQTFPFPEDLSNLEQIGEAYHEFRRQFMLDHHEGLTKTYNRFHAPEEGSADIARLRQLHVEMDNAVAAAYGWDDLDLGHGFHETPQGLRFTISEAARREVLTRLLQLNHERYEEEVAQGLHDKKKSTSKKKSASTQKKPGRNKQLSLLAEAEAAPKPEQETLIDVEKPKPAPSTDIGDWDQCVCLGCGKHLAGFMMDEHTRKVHQGEDPGYRKI